MTTNGAQPVPAGTLEAQSVADITRQISAAFAEFDKSDSARKLAVQDAKTAGDATIGAREKLLRSVASVAHRAAWSDDDTAEAVKKAVEQHAGNDKSKKSSLSTFASEIKLASSKRVRGRVAEMFDLAREAWELEQLDDSEGAPKPLRKAFSRMYHVVVQGMMRAAKDGRPVPTTTDELADFAQATLDARRIDTKRVKARLDNIRKELQSFTADFGAVDGLAECIEFMGDISESDLKAAWERKSQGDAQPAPAPEPEQEDEPDDESEPQSANELLEDALRDMTAMDVAA